MEKVTVIKSYIIFLNLNIKHNIHFRLTVFLFIQNYLNIYSYFQICISPSLEIKAVTCGEVFIKEKKILLTYY